MKYQLFPEKMKITAVPAIPQSLGTGKAYLFQTAVCHIINIAKQAAQFLTAVFLAGCMPESFCDCHIIGIFGMTLNTFLQVRGAHDFKKNVAVNRVKSRY